MSAEKILNEDWSEVDNKKKRVEDRGFVSCTESYEIETLIKYCRKHFPYKTDAAIKQVISECCVSVKGNKPRKEFVQCVAAKLES